LSSQTSLFSKGTAVYTLDGTRPFRGRPDVDDNRTILVRVIVPNSDNSHDKIIKATNSQTRIPVAYLRATDQIQKDIELFFESRGLYYERRKNAHKNNNRPKDKIIALPYLAQAVMAIVLQEPNNSRARPSSLLKDQQEYERVFNRDYPIKLYYVCARIMKAIDSFLRTNLPEDIVKNRNNVRFHLAMFATALRAGKPRPTPQEIAALPPEEFTPEFLSSCLTTVWEELKKQLRGTTTPDHVAKSREFVEALKDRLVKSFR
ncbi:MAG: AIPR family protein, partial [Firmicutes bacterium]|nr:AIPR family protein [Bacillota bacterium]